MFAYSLPVEQAIARRAGASFWATAALRLGAAITYGGAVSWTCHAMGWLLHPISFDWRQGLEMAEADVGFGDWLRGTAFSMALTYAVILALLVLLDIMERTGITRALTPVRAGPGWIRRLRP